MPHSWQEGKRVLLEVADTPDRNSFGRKAAGVLERTYSSNLVAGGGRNAAFVRLEGELLENVENVVVYFRARHRIWRSYSVSVVPWSQQAPSEAQIDDMAMRKRIVCLAEMKFP